MSGSIANLPGGWSRILFGGTRNAVKLSRPWQGKLQDLINPETCVFETKPQEELPLPAGSPKGWKLFPNIFTPHARHRLIIPEKCWPAEKLQEWGGMQALGEAFSIAAMATAEERVEITLLAFVGYLGGQNLGHPHMHILHSFADQPLEASDLLTYAEDERIRIFEDAEWTVVAGGARAGECFVIPKFPLRFSDANFSLAKTLSRIIALGNEAFTSKEGLPPHYGLLVRIESNGNIRYADYCPTLSVWGVLQYAASSLEGEPYVLPWPHETTAEFLRAHNK